MPSGTKLHGHGRSSIVSGVSIKLKNDKTYSPCEDLDELKESLVLPSDCDAFPTLSLDKDNLFLELQDGSFSIYPIKKPIDIGPFRGCVVRYIDRADDHVTLLHPKFETSILIDVTAYNEAVEHYEEKQKINDGIDHQLVKVLDMIKRVKGKMYLLHEKQLIREQHLAEGHEFFDDIVRDLKSLKGYFNSTAQKQLLKV